eukprot:scaffold154482_cov22-Tisochrysis_lutea.AAC.1
MSGFTRGSQEGNGGGYLPDATHATDFGAELEAAAEEMLQSSQWVRCLLNLYLLMRPMPLMLGQSLRLLLRRCCRAHSACDACRLYCDRGHNLTQAQACMALRLTCPLPPHVTPQQSRCDNSVLEDSGKAVLEDADNAFVPCAHLALLATTTLYWHACLTLLATVPFATVPLLNSKAIVPCAHLALLATLCLLACFLDPPSHHALCHFFTRVDHGVTVPCACFFCSPRFELGRSRALQDFDEATNSMGKDSAAAGEGTQGPGAGGGGEDDDDIVMGGGNQELLNNRCPITQKSVSAAVTTVGFGLER